jgi:eukaryotic-like serine/threonine-protein kinase
MVAFFAERRLKAVDVASGAVRVVAWLANPRSLGGTWNRFGEILFSVPDDAMYLVPAAGGTPRRLSAADVGCEGCGSWPSFLPDGRHFLYTVAGSDPSTSGIYVAEIGKAGRQRLLDVMSSCSYAPPGALFYARSGTLYAQPFDVGRIRVTGAPVPLADTIAYNGQTGRVPFSASETGILAFRSTLLTELVWIDRTGRRQNVAARRATYLGFSIGPDGRRIAAARLDRRSGTSDVWVLDGERETRVTDDPDGGSAPVWSEDGDYIAYASRRGNRWRIYRRKATAVAAEELLVDSDTPVIPLQVFRSTRVVYAARAAKPSFDVWRLADGRPTPLLRTGGFYPSDGRLSPDERWFAYSIPEANGGAWNQTVYVSSPRAPDNRRAIAESASAPRWRADGQELFYLSKDASVVAIPVDPRGTPSEAPGEMLFRTLALSHSGLTGEIYDVTPDGRRFLMKMEAGSSPIHVILHWEARVGE